MCKHIVDLFFSKNAEDQKSNSAVRKIYNLIKSF